MARFGCCSDLARYRALANAHIAETYAKKRARANERNAYEHRHATTFYAILKY